MRERNFYYRLVLAWVLFIFGTKGLNAQETDSTQQVDKFADTTGGYGFMYLSTTCIECNPKGSAHYKKFAIISGFYKARDFYSSVATRSVAHFKNKFEKLGYFKDKVTQTWKSPRLFATLQEITEYRNDLIAKLKSENYVVVFFDDRINTEELERE
ncbi:MAG: hypothetical protein IBJ16_01120 [Chitinophagaceae bacterium]|nr:hypothetical protein [Chitinophagaceae bacterium]